MFVFFSNFRIFSNFLSKLGPFKSAICFWEATTCSTQEMGRKRCFLTWYHKSLLFFWFCVSRSCLTRGFPKRFFFKQCPAPSTEAFVWPSFHFHNFTQRFYQRNRHLVSSVGRAPLCWAGGRGIKPRPDLHSGFLNNWEQKCCFCNDICKRLKFLVFSDKDEKP